MKMFKFIFPLSALLTLSLSCINDDGFFPNNNCLKGNGAIISESRTMADFHSINNTIAADIYLSQGPQEDIIIEAQQNILQELKTEIFNNQLRISFDRCVDISQKVKMHIIIPDIRRLVLTGVGDVIAQNSFLLTDLDVVLTGVGDFNLQGTCNTLDITLTGVGNVEAFELNADISDVDITGVGNAEVFVNDELNVLITGSGKVYYKGNPSINSTVTGSGQIVNAN